MAAVVKPRIAQYVILGTVCALVIGVYGWSARWGREQLGGLNAAKAYYNLLFRRA